MLMNNDFRLTGQGYELQDVRIVAVSVILSSSN